MLRNRDLNVRDSHFFSSPIMQKLYAAGGAPGGFPGGAPGGFPGAAGGEEGPSVEEVD